jgi:hypothetical protein
MRESSPSIAKKLILIGVFYKRFIIQFINYFLVQIKENQAVKYKRSFISIIAQLHSYLLNLYIVNAALLIKNGS